MAARACADCGADISRRHSPAIYCFGCGSGRSRRGGAARAWRIVNKAVASGLLPAPKSLTCVDCGGPARDYEHRDYSQPLAVQPVCRSCNKLRGGARRVDAATLEALRRDAAARSGRTRSGLCKPGAKGYSKRKGLSCFEAYAFGRRLGTFKTEAEAQAARAEAIATHAHPAPAEAQVSGPGALATAGGA